MGGAAIPWDRWRLARPQLVISKVAAGTTAVQVYRKPAAIWVARSERARLIAAAMETASLPALGRTIVDSRGGPSGRPLGASVSQRFAKVTAPVSSASKREI